MPVDPAFDEPRRLALVVFVLLAVVTTIALARGRRAVIPRSPGSSRAWRVIVLGALTWGGSPLGVVPLAIQLAVLAAATGGVFAAMILGHWYLVTPRLPEAPLVHGVATAAVDRRAADGAVPRLGRVRRRSGLGGRGGGGPFSALVGPWALFVWLRLLIGLVFPLIVSWAALQTARTRSMESATGLLYIDVGAIAAGTILAAGLYFGAGLLV